MTALVMGWAGFFLYLAVRGAVHLSGEFARFWQVLGGLVLLGLIFNIGRILVNGPGEQLLGFVIGATVAPMVVGVAERFLARRTT